MTKLTPFRSLSFFTLRSFIPRHSFNPAATFQQRSIWLDRTQIQAKIEDDIRNRFPGEPEEVVEEVARARRGIWEGLIGRKSNLAPPDYVQLTC